MTQKPFRPGDDVAVVTYIYWAKSTAITWRGKVEKIHKNGTVVTSRGDKYRANGASFKTSSEALHHITPELESILRAYRAQIGGAA